MYLEQCILSKYRFELCRRFGLNPRLATEIIELGNSLIKTPIQGKSLGAGLYKIRLASKSKGTGKSGGFRVVTYYVEQIADGEVVYLVTIYDKSEEATIRKEDLLDLVSNELGPETE